MTAGRCPSCRSALAPGQRYCVACGEQRFDVRASLTARPVVAATSTSARPGPRPGVRPAVLGITAAVALGAAMGALADPSGTTSLAAGPSRPTAPSPTQAVAARSGDLAALQAPQRAAPAVPAPTPAVAEAPATAPTAPAEPATPAPAPAPEPATQAPAARDEDDEPAPAAPAEAPPPRPPAKHVVVVSLVAEGVRETFAAGTRSTYVARELRRQGALLRGFRAAGRGSLANGVALLSGQGSNPALDAGCAALDPFVARGAPGADGQLPGTGCVFGVGVPSLPAQLAGQDLPWKAYVEGTPPAPQPAACPAPAAQPDGSRPGLERHPLLLFSALTGAADCTTRITGLDPLAADYATAAAAPAFAMIVPDACHAGVPGACPPGQVDGLPAADAWLSHVAPLILGSKAFADDGLLVVTFDQARPPGPGADGERRMGAIVLSPHVRPGTVSERRYDQYSLLRTIEDALDLPALGYAGAKDAEALGRDVFTATTG